MIFVRYEGKLGTVLLLTRPLSIWCEMPWLHLGTPRPCLPGYSYNKVASCSDVLCLVLNPNSSLQSGPRLVTSLKILAGRILSNILPVISTALQDKGTASSSQVSGWRLWSSDSILVESATLGESRWKVVHGGMSCAGEDASEPYWLYH
jgi:hypothetical protein